MVQAIGAFLFLLAISAVFYFWVPLAQKSLTSDSALDCSPVSSEPYKLYLHKSEDRKSFKAPDLSKGCAGQILVYKLFL